MIEAVVELAFSNALLSAVLAMVAWIVHRHGRYPSIAHLLWVVVLIKAITPPLLILPAPWAGVNAVLPPSGSWSGGIGEAAVSGVSAPLPTVGISPLDVGLAVFFVLWLAGSAAVLVASLRRIQHFGRLLRDSSMSAPPGLEIVAASVARELGLRSSPPIILTRARISPMTWWTRGRIRLVLPAALLDCADPAEMRWVLAHELAHVKRRDHLVRWIEWLAAVAFWWNPIVWWARRNLRRAEEDACDALVVQRVAGAPRAYAGTLLSVVEILAQPMGHVPAMATGIDAARSLEHRLSMIVGARASHHTPGPLVVGLSAVVVTFMALGLGSPPIEPAAAGSPSPPSAATIGVDEEEAAAQAAPAGYSTVSATLPVGMTRAAHIYRGTAGPDSYTGSSAGETISGFGGADTLTGGAGADAISGGDGNDALRGGAGRDTIRGGGGADVIGGGAGRDEIHGGAGDDVVRAWADGTPDRVDCGVGVDRAIVDRSDSTTRCETVVVRDPS